MPLLFWILISISNIGNAGAQALANIRLLSLDVSYNRRIDATGTHLNEQRKQQYAIPSLDQLVLTMPK